MGVSVGSQFSPKAQRSGFGFTDGGDHGAHKVESPREVPSGSEPVHPDPGSVRLLVLAQQRLQGVQVHPVSPGEIVQLLPPKVTGSKLGGVLQGREDGGAAEQVEQDEPGQEAETGVVFVHGDPGAAVAAAGGSPPPSHGDERGAGTTRTISVTRSGGGSSPSCLVKRTFGSRRVTVNLRTGSQMYAGGYFHHSV